MYKTPNLKMTKLLQAASKENLIIIESFQSTTVSIEEAWPKLPNSKCQAFFITGITIWPL